MSADPYMNKLAADYRNAYAALWSHRGNRFQFRQLVRVDCSRYHGLGSVDRDPACPPDNVPVLLGNGNTWWYPVEAVTPVSEQTPRELRHAILDKAHINHL